MKSKMPKLPLRHKVAYKTKQEYVYQILHQAIMECSLVPGEKLVISEIAKQLDVSTIPVREALQLLLAEDLVNYNAHAGAIVAPITKDSIVETFTIKEGLESVATRVATSQVTKADIEKMQEKLLQMDGLLEGNNFDQWGEINADFHGLIVDIAKMPTLKAMHIKIVDKWNRIHKYYFSDVSNDRHAISQEEHYAIVNAIVNGESEQAELLTKRHNQNALKDYMAKLEV